MRCDILTSLNQLLLIAQTVGIYPRFVYLKGQDKLSGGLSDDVSPWEPIGTMAVQPMGSLEQSDVISVFCPMDGVSRRIGR